MDKDLEKFLYTGEEGQERQKQDLDADLDSYWQQDEDQINTQPTLADVADPMEANE